MWRGIGGILSDTIEASGMTEKSLPPLGILGAVAWIPPPGSIPS